MNIHKFKVNELSKSQLKKVNGGGLGQLILGAAALTILAYNTAMNAAENLGYADGKANCPPPPCTE